jgi:hypothetical protein
MSEARYRMSRSAAGAFMVGRVVAVGVGVLDAVGVGDDAVGPVVAAGDVRAAWGGASLAERSSAVSEHPMVKTTRESAETTRRIS